jgi:hypothetical protein
MTDEKNGAFSKNYLEKTCPSVTKQSAKIKLIFPVSDMVMVRNHF